MSQIKIECNACGKEAVIKNKLGDIDVEDIKYCPYCGESEDLTVE